VTETDHTKTEIACHAKGVHHVTKRASTVLDIGGQDSKVIRVSETGRVEDFKMNRKCAAGTGAFLEEMSRRMGLSLDQIAVLADQTDVAAPVSAFCTVFAGSEILAAAKKGTPKAAIARGIYSAIVERVLSLAALSGTVILTGGIAAYHPVFGRLLADKMEGTLFIPPLPQYIGALGAALFAGEAGRRITGESR
jgi:predicted CoA-substrate-specific enzyme activase